MIEEYQVYRDGNVKAFQIPRKEDEYQSCGIIFLDGAVELWVEDCSADESITFESLEELQELIDMLEKAKEVFTVETQKAK